MFTGLIHPGEKERIYKELDQLEQNQQQAEAERAEAARPVNWQEYKQAMERNQHIDILRLDVSTCPEDTREIYAGLQRKAKQQRRA